MSGMSSKDLAKIAETLKKESPKLFEEVFQNRSNPDAQKIMKEKWDQVAKALGKGGVGAEEIEADYDGISANDIELSSKTKKKIKWILIAVIAVSLIQIAIIVLLLLPKM